jgi:rhodanese-related sulfurtransferase
MPVDSPETLTPEQVAELHRQGAIQLVDVREPYEHEAGFIEGDQHVEFSRLSEQAASIDKERPVVFYCRSGGRSAVATQAFRASGYDARNMSGGLLAWDRGGLPIKPDGGTIADH